MERYKIGSVAQFLGLSSEALRYYEKNGILDSQRDDENGYRYYSTWDINYLLDCTYYRAFNFPVSDVKYLIKDASLKELAEHCHAQQMELLRQLNSLRGKLDALCSLEHSLAEVEEKIGRIELAGSPPLIFRAHRHNSALLTDADAAYRWDYWNERKPLVKNTFLFPRRAQNGMPENEYFWGYSLPTEMIGADDKKRIADARYIPGTKCLHTVFKAYGENTFFQALETQVRAMSGESAYIPSEKPIIGHLLARVHENEQIVRYCEAWVPIE